MLFGEKVAALRKEKGIKQKDFCEEIGVSLRTLRGWELEGRYPRQRELYKKVAETLGCDENYLLMESEEFTATVTERYSTRGAVQAKDVLEEAKALYAGGDLTDEDRLVFLQDIQRLFLESKEIAREKLTSKNKRKN